MQTIKILRKHVMPKFIDYTPMDLEKVLDSKYKKMVNLLRYIKKFYNYRTASSNHIFMRYFIDCNFILPILGKTGMEVKLLNGKKCLENETIVYKQINSTVFLIDYDIVYTDELIFGDIVIKNNTKIFNMIKSIIGSKYLPIDLPYYWLVLADIIEMRLYSIYYKSSTSVSPPIFPFKNIYKGKPIEPKYTQYDTLIHNYMIELSKVYAIKTDNNSLEAVVSIYNIDKILELNNIIKTNKMPDIENIGYSNKQQKMRYELQRRSYENKYKASRYIELISETFGYNRVNKIIASLSRFETIDNFDVVVAKLIETSKKGSNDATVINDLYEVQLKLYNAILNNKCPHVEIYKKLRRAKRLEDIIKFYKELLAFCEIDEYVMCNNCKLTIACIHEIEYFGMLNKKYNIAKINEIMEQYKNNMGHCKICGVIIKKDNDPHVGLLLKTMTTQDNYIKKIMWVYCSQIYDALGLDKILNLNQFASNITTECYDLFILLKSDKSNVDPFEQFIDSETQYQILLFIYAYIRLLIKNKVITINIDLDVDSILKFINKNHPKVCGKIKIIPTVAKKVFNNIYKFLHEHTTKNLTFNNNINIFISNIINNPSYIYIKYMMFIFDQLDLHPKTPKTIQDKFKKIMGRSLEDCLINTNIKVVNDLISNKINSIIDEYMSKNENIYKFGDQLFSKAYDGTINKKAVVKYKYILHDNYDMNYEYKLTSFKNYMAYLITGKSPKIESFINEHLKIFYSKFNKLDSTNILKIENDISKVYDENGIKHKWILFLYKTAKEVKALTTKEIKKEYESGSLIGQYIDIGCIICKARYSETDKLNKDKINISLFELNKYDVFFNYYLTNCPLGKTHEILNDVCSKCKINIITLKENISSHKFDDLKDYYIKYGKQTYLKAKFIPIKYKQIDINLYNKNKETMELNYSNVTRINKLISESVNPIILEYLGCLEKMDYNNVINKIMEIEITSYTDNRLFSMDNIIKYVINNYSIFINCYKLSNIKVKFINDLLEKYNITKDKQKDIFEYRIFISYSKEISAAFGLYTPIGLYKFMLNYFIKLILDIYDSSEKKPEWYKPIIKEYATLQLNEILLMEKAKCNIDIKYTNEDTSYLDENELIEETVIDDGDENELDISEEVIENNL